MTCGCRDRNSAASTNFLWASACCARNGPRRVRSSCAASAPTSPPFRLATSIWSARVRVAHALAGRDDLVVQILQLLLDGARACQPIGDLVILDALLRFDHARA